VKGPSRRALRMLAALLALGLAWAAAAAAVHRGFLPGPLATVARFAARMSDGTLGRHLAASAWRIGLALALSALPACCLGLAAGRRPGLDAVVTPFIYILHPIPKVAFLPIILLFLGLGDTAKVFLIGLIIFGQLVVSARDAARGVSATALDSVRSLGASELDLARHVVLPAALPSLLTALRVGLGTSIAVLFIAETFASESGLGWFIMDAWSRVDYLDMYAAIAALSLFGLVCYLLVDALEAALCRWRKAGA
jgi:ABC-type nitrate/sulfonate/bicarbonate transport system permease component